MFFSQKKQTCFFTCGGNAELKAILMAAPKSINCSSSSLNVSIAKLDFLYIKNPSFLLFSQPIPPLTLLLLLMPLLPSSLRPPSPIVCLPLLLWPHQRSYQALMQHYPSTIPGRVGVGHIPPMLLINTALHGNFHILY